MALWKIIIYTHQVVAIMEDELINQRFEISLQVLTPLSIGAGAEYDWVKGVDFVVKGGKLYHLNLHKIEQAGINIENLTNAFAQKDAESLLRYLGNRLDSVTDAVFNMPCNSDNDIKAFLHNQFTGHPVVAGSSLKGAIRSVLFTYLRDKQRYNDEVFGRMNDGTDFMRFIRVSDFEFEKTDLVNTKIYNLHTDNRHNWLGGWKHNFRNGTNTSFSPTGFNTIYECLMPSSEAQGSIMLSKKLFELLTQHGPKQPCFYKKKELFYHVGNDRYGKNKISPIENLFYQINLHTKDYLEKELLFFTKFNQGENCDRIIDSIKHLTSQVKTCIDNGDSCILKMAAGTGFHSITGDWQYNDYSNTRYWQKGKDKGKKKYKSRKIAINGKQFTLMGFVKLSK